MARGVQARPWPKVTCARMAEMPGDLPELPDPSLSQALPAVFATGEFAGAAPASQPMSWGWWCVCVAVGLGTTVGSAWFGSTLRPSRAVRREGPAEVALIADGIHAYESGDWTASVTAFELLLEAHPGHARALDYLNRIELTLQDADRLRLAEGALVAGQVFDAERLARAVLPNSPLYAQAEAVARTSVEQRNPSGAAAADGGTPSAAPALDIHAALGEALGLFEAGHFSGAAQRALSLADQATPESRQKLLRWAQDCRKFAQRYSHLPEEPHVLVRHMRELREAIALDEALSHGHYARKLRARASVALADAARGYLDRGDAVGGCQRVNEAAELDPRGPNLAALGARCGAEAERRLTQARSMERQRPMQALKLYRQASALAGRDTYAYRAARAGIEALGLSDGR